MERRRRLAAHPACRVAFLDVTIVMMVLLLASFCPASFAACGNCQYQVQAGDSMSTIAKNFNCLSPDPSNPMMTKICNINGMSCSGYLCTGGGTCNSVSVGQCITIHQQCTGWRQWSSWSSCSTCSGTRFDFEVVPSQNPRSRSHIANHPVPDPHRTRTRSC